MVDFVIIRHHKTDDYRQDKLHLPANCQFPERDETRIEQHPLQVATAGKKTCRLISLFFPPAGRLDSKLG